MMAAGECTLTATLWRKRRRASVVRQWLGNQPCSQSCDVRWDTRKNWTGATAQVFGLLLHHGQVASCKVSVQAVVQVRVLGLSLCTALLAVVMSELSCASSRAENIAHFTEAYGVDLASAELLYRAEKLQERGQLDQALAYFDQVLQQNPNVTAARVNADMIRRMQSKVTSTPPRNPSVRVNAAMTGRTPAEVPSTVLGVQSGLPREAELSWYGEDGSLPGMSCEFYCSIKRLRDGRSEYWATTGVQEEMGVAPIGVVFPVLQSDRMWTELLAAIKDGRGLSRSDPTPRDWAWGTVGEELTVRIKGQKDQIYYTNGDSPVERILKKFLTARRAELGCRNR